MPPPALPTLETLSRALHMMDASDKSSSTRWCQLTITKLRGKKSSQRISQAINLHVDAVIFHCKCTEKRKIADASQMNGLFFFFFLTNFLLIKRQLPVPVVKKETKR